MASYIYYDISIGIVLCIIPKPEKSIFCRVLSCLVLSCRVVSCCGFGFLARTTNGIRKQRNRNNSEQQSNVVIAFHCGIHFQPFFSLRRGFHMPQ